jgi:hypothetical protein
VRDYGLVGDGATSDTAAIQAALDACGAAGGGVVWIPIAAHNYILTAAGVNTYKTNTPTEPHQYCLDLKYDNATLQIDGVLQLANGQQTDAAGAVDLIVMGNRKHITLTGRGSIIGNTAGQTGWTQGYEQNSEHGGIIVSYGDVVNHVEDLLIEGLTLGDHFSNPINIGYGAVAVNQRVVLRNLYGYNCGEGFQVLGTNAVTVENVRYEDLTGVSGGDDIEVSSCSNFLIDQCTVKGSGGGSAFDLTKSLHGVLSNFVVDKTNGDAFDIQPGVGQTVTDIVACNGVVNAPTGFGISGDTIDRIHVSNIQFTAQGTPGAGSNFCMGGKVHVTDRIVVDNCSFDGFGSGISIGTVNNYTLSNISIKNCAVGIGWTGKSYADTVADVANLLWDGITIDTTTYAINFQGNSIAGKDPTGAIKNVVITNSTYDILPQNNIVLSGVEFDNFTPSATVTPFSASFYCIAPYRFFSSNYSTDSFATFPLPSKGQIIIFRFIQINTIVDESQSGGNNIKLAGGVNFTGGIGDRVCLEYDETTGHWLELWRSLR